MKAVKRSLKAIGLLELMLAIALIAVLLIMATRYYSSASGSQKVQAATGMVNAVRGAFLNYIAGQQGGQPAVSIQSLVQAGYLPSAFVASGGNSSQTNPWGMSIGISSDPTQNTFAVTLGTPSAEVCTEIQQQVISTEVGILSSQTVCGADNTLTATFYK